MNTELRPELFETKEEWELYLLLEKAEKIQKERMDKGDYLGALTLFSEPIVIDIPPEARRFYERGITPGTI